MRIIILLYLFTLLKYSSAQSVGGSLSSNTIVCSGANNGLLSLSTYTGAIIRWEYAYTNTGPWTPIFFTSSTYNYVNLIQSTYFRVIVQQSGYAQATSNFVLVTCDNMSIGGVISTNTLQCINAPASLTLSGNTGSVVSWECSTNNWFSTTTLTTLNTLTTISNPILATTQLRTKIKNGVCPVVFSNSVLIVPASISDAGVLSGLQNVCAGSNSCTIVAANYTGVIQNWESSASSGGPFNVISSTSNTLNVSNLNQSTWYRLVVKNANCASASSPAHPIQVHAMSFAGTVIGTSSVCSLNNTGSLHLVSSTGSVSQWQVSNNGGGTWNGITNTATVNSFTNLSTTSVFRAKVQNGICPSVFSSSFTVMVHQVPNVNFAVTNACENSVLNFTNTTNGTFVYSWDFKDGSSSSATHPSHTFFSSGTYTVKLTATSQNACVDSVKHVVTIFPKPQANFTCQDTSCFGTPIVFNNASTILSGSISHLKFEFKDGSPNSTISPISHNFLSDGAYSISLIVTSNLGCKDSLSKSILIYPKPNSNFFSSNVCKGAQVPISNMSLLSNGSLQHHWNFGNSVISNLINPTYTYTNAGTYTISLITISNHNCKDTLYKQITIHENPSINISANNACQGSAVIFNNSITPSNITNTVTLYFGDGFSGNSLNSSHIYSLSGTYLSQLTLITDSGCSSTISKMVSVFPKPKSNFSFNQVCALDSISFLNFSSISSGNLNFEWNFGNSMNSNFISPKSTYSFPGNYTVQLIVKSELDCSDTLSKILHVFAKPQANFNFSNSCDGNPITFTNTSNYFGTTIKSTAWNFGDNSFSFEIEPQKQYLNHGNYSVSLVVLSNEGCADTVIQKVNVFEGPIANFNANNVCFNTTTKFQNLSLINSGSFTSKWKFDDEEISEDHSADHLYKKTGQFNVTLIINSNNGCIDSISKFVECFPLPIIKVMNDTSVKKGFGINLFASGARTYNWYPTLGLNNPESATPFANPDIDMIYVVTGTDANGCNNFDTLDVKVKDDFLVIPYNILTPNGNGLNDTWIIKNIESYPNNSVLIFDQWNQKVFEGEGYHSEWEGKNSKGELLPDATYYYILKFKDSEKIYKGYITLLRNE